MYLSVFPFFAFSFFLLLHSPPSGLLDNSSHLPDCGKRRP